MAKFAVTVYVKKAYTVMVEADDESDAAEAAIEIVDTTEFNQEPDSVGIHHEDCEVERK
jgi:hypothetical protein